MILAAMFFFLVSDAGAGPAEGEALSPQMELAELCAEYQDLSDRLASDYIASRSGAAEDLVEGQNEQLSVEERAARRKAFYKQVQSQVRYNQTKRDLRDVVEKLGTRECPSQDYDNFEPLIDDA